MSEMLANQYFLARNYSKAILVLQDVLQTEPKNIKCLKKLIICHSQLGDVAAAKAIFLKILRDNPAHIIQTDPLADDCPCPEIVQDMERKTVLADDLAAHYAVLGMLYLYCDIRKSILYLEKSLKVSPKQGDIGEMVRLLKSYCRSEALKA